MKYRLDRLLVDKGLAETRSKATGIIMAGEVMVDGHVLTKAGSAVDENCVIHLKEVFPYVSRGASKLMTALDAFDIDLKGLIAIDVGASTGGFCDLMLQRGAKKIYAVDVGHKQLHWRLRNDSRIINMEGVNARMLDTATIKDPCDLATFDVSFISLKLVIPPVLKVIKEGAGFIALIKPQFEAGKNQVGKGGIVRDQGIIDAVLKDMNAFFMQQHLEIEGIVPSSIKGAKGNQEYLCYALYRGKR
ncbi:MAG: TlyA family RNA methyltransferase [Thermodesulfobacteriota bacterium]|nr:TlyA family RNA methyltransferase [Thermodesulfobacteriota bacterium]